MDRAKWPANAGLVAHRRARSTGTLVSVYDNAAAGLDDEGGAMPYSTVCEAHSGLISHPNKTLALDWMASPEEWCPTCSGEIPDPHATPVKQATA